MSQTRERVKNAILLISDAVSIFLSYFVAGYIWMVMHRHYSLEVYSAYMKSNIIPIFIAYFVTILVYTGNAGLLQRSFLKEVKVVVIKGMIMAAVVAVYEFLTKDPVAFPRGLYALLLVSSTILALVLRCIVKAVLVHEGTRRNATARLMLITTSGRAQDVTERIAKQDTWLRKLVSVVIIDKDITGSKILGVPVVANADTMIDYFKREIVDEVFIDLEDNEVKELRDLLLVLEDMGITVHINLGIIKIYDDFAVSFSEFGDIPVATLANRFYDFKQLAIKRVFDVIGSIVGLAITAVVMIFVAPAIKIESKGPLFFKQKRVGKNGRYFYIYKFRSMYMDAEDRLKELMEKNEMSGLMFKMADDPRITKVGKFIRKTSIDELPQFFNVLKGDMSLVGTRPPTVAEFKQYKGHHKRRLSMKPGITGMWQAYGRNSVVDFEDVVKMDLDYIDNWSLGLDIKILLKTVQTVFSGK